MNAPFQMHCPVAGQHDSENSRSGRQCDWFRRDEMFGGGSQCQRLHHGIGKSTNQNDLHGGLVSLSINNRGSN